MTQVNDKLEIDMLEIIEAPKDILKEESYRLHAMVDKGIQFEYCDICGNTFNTNDMVFHFAGSIGRESPGLIHVCSDCATYQKIKYISFNRMVK